MLNVPTPFPEVGSYGFMDDRAPDGRDVVERVRILARKGADQVLVSLESRRFPREIASGNRTVPLAILRESERAEPAKPAKPKPSGRKPKAPRR